MTSRRLSIAAVLLLCGCVLDAAPLVDPVLHFRTLRTDHFVVYFHQGEDRLAGRLAAIAEETWLALRQPLGVTPPRLTHVLLVDQTELSNGFATPVPYDTVFVTAVPPAGSDFIANTDDWLRLAFTHEFTHIVHLDRSEGWARVVRGIFGRTPIAFPNLFLPTWEVEGLAAYEESVVTGAGRLHAGNFRAITSEAARAGRFDPLDRVNGGLVDWPGGDAPYAYGVGFHAYLADTYGAASLARLADASAHRVPYTASRVFERIYGKPLGDLWKDYERRITTAAVASAPPDDALRVTRQGFIAAGPRFASASEIVYSVRTPHAFPALESVRTDGSARRRLATRYLGSTIGITPATIYFDQQELRRNVGVYSDLYALDRRSGRVRALTSESRLLDPDASPDGRSLVCVHDAAPGRRDLVVIATTGLDRADTAGLKSRPTSVVPTSVVPDFVAPAFVGQDSSPAVTVLISEADTQFNAPRWSPDGRLIAVERHRLGSLPQVVLVDPTTRAVRVIGSRTGVRMITPAWRRDGLAVIAAVAGQDEPFNLYEFTIADGASRQLTHTTGGATWPDVSPDGRTIVFVGYTADGFDVFTIEYSQPRLEADAAARTPRPIAPDARNAPAPGPQDGLPSRGYAPWSTLRPTSWSPTLVSDGDQIRAGAGVAGNDVLQYHAYAASASWLIQGPADAVSAREATPDWQAAYAYTRWRPTFFAAASSQTSFFAGPATAAGTPSSATERERQLEAGVLVPFRHVRASHFLSASWLRAVDDFSFLDGQLTRNRTALRAAWSTTTAQLYGYSISPEHGVTIGATSEMVRRALGAFGDATTFTADARVYLPGAAAQQVVAIRAAGGASSGDIEMQRTFHLGGPGPNADPADFGRSAASLLRGFGADTFAGTRIATLNADYRFPLAYIQRGIGTWPIFVQTLHAALFADAGHAWSGAFRAADIKTAAGAELSADVVAGYLLPLTAAVGVAWGRDGSGTVANGATVYVRLGRAF